MKQFDLQEYLKNPNRKIITRDGRSVRIICTDRKSDTLPIVVLIEGCYQENICEYTKDGLYSRGVECRCNLFFAPIKKEGWVNIYKYNSKITIGSLVYNTKEEAESAAGDKSYYISTIKIEWKE